jgi:preprotein translocase subunit SecG
MLVYILYGLFFLSCVILIVSVLLQPGKTDAGALFTSNISSTAFGPRGTQTILSKITIATAAVFFISALLLAMPALTGNYSVLQSVGETPAAATEAPATNANAADTNANAATNANTAVNSAPADANTGAAANSGATTTNGNQ